MLPMLHRLSRFYNNLSKLKSTYLNIKGASQANFHNLVDTIFDGFTVTSHLNLKCLVWFFQVKCAFISGPKLLSSKMHKTSQHTDTQLSAYLLALKNIRYSIEMKHSKTDNSKAAAQIQRLTDKIQ